MNDVQNLLTKFIQMDNGDYELIHIDSIAWLAKDYGFKYRNHAKRLCRSYTFPDGKSFSTIYETCCILFENNVPFIVTNKNNALIYDGHSFNETGWLDWDQVQKKLIEINNYPEFQEKYKFFKLMEGI